MSDVTPMMAQFLEIKAAHPGDLLFYRMGDFYEMFFEDAVAAAEALDIALTKRGKHQGQDIPMCGVPVHAAEGYLHQLTRKGFRVAICDQLEDPSEAKKRGYKAVVKRGVTRVVTAGTLTEDSLLEARSNNYLASYAELRGEGAIAWCDISTGTLTVAPCPRLTLGPQLARLLPRELLCAEAAEEGLRETARDMGLVLTPSASGASSARASFARLSSSQPGGRTGSAMVRQLLRNPLQIGFQVIAHHRPRRHQLQPGQQPRILGDVQRHRASQHLRQPAAQVVALLFRQRPRRVDLDRTGGAPAAAMPAPPVCARRLQIARRTPSSTGWRT